MSPARLLVLSSVLLVSACAHRPLSGSDLDRVKHPAFISRIEEHAGPQALVFREDGRYQGKLKKLDPKEADRRLAGKLSKGITRFEVWDRLRATTQAQLPAVRPWTTPVSPARVASVLESYLVDEVPANRPDYELLRPLGADAVVEFVIENYGLKSENGGAYAFLQGHARMFRLDGGELWRFPLELDGRRLKRDPLDPFAVAQEPERFRIEMVALINELSAQLARELSPGGRRDPAQDEGRGGDGREGSGRGSDEGGLDGPPDDTNRTGKQPKDELPPGELPPPDPSSRG
jgi:hypothetical protein